MTEINKIKNKVFIVYVNLLVFFIFGLIYTFFPIAFPEQKNGVFNESRMLIKYTFSTRLVNKVLDGNQMEKNDAITLIGNAPDKSLNLEACLDSDFIVYGYVVGTTAQIEDTDQGAIPVFYVEKWKPTRYLMNIVYNQYHKIFFKWYMLYSFFFILGNMFLGFLMLFNFIANKKPKIPFKSPPPL
jgi:hypothetical protein